MDQSLIKKDAFAVSPSDIIIAVMGPTGAGKSNLIEHFLSTSKGGGLGISKEGLKSGTSSVHAYRIRNHPTYRDRIILVDTPGFDDTHLPDLAILTMIGTWLDKTYRQSDRATKLAGILYLHRITDNRMTGTANRNLKMFGQLCGKDAASKVILVTTMWDRMTTADKVATTQSRVRQLEETHWKELISAGSTIHMFQNTVASAADILSKVVSKEDDRRILHLQEELVHLEKPIKETDAGVTLYNTLQGLLKEQRETLDSLMKEEAVQNDPALLESLREQRIQIERQLQQSLKDIEELKVGLFARLFSFLRFKKALSRAIELGDSKS